MTNLNELRQPHDPLTLGRLYREALIENNWFPSELARHMEPREAGVDALPEFAAWRTYTPGYGERANVTARQHDRWNHILYHVMLVEMPEIAREAVIAGQVDPHQFYQIVRVRHSTEAMQQVIAAAIDGMPYSRLEELATSHGGQESRWNKTEQRMKQRGSAPVVPPSAPAWARRQAAPAAPARALRSLAWLTATLDAAKRLGLEDDVEVVGMRIEYNARLAGR
jgi:hypothetical protein